MMLCDVILCKPNENISGGLSNILFYCSLPSTHTPLNGEPTQVLLRMYGQLHSEDSGPDASTEISSITDSVIFMLLSERKLGPKLYGIFPGGRLEEYIPARAMMCQELRDASLSAIIARKLANVHTLDVPINKEPTWLFSTINSWLQTIRSKGMSAVQPNEIVPVAQELLSFDFETEIQWLESYLKQVKSPTVFCHNDLQEGNILLPDLHPHMSHKRMSTSTSQNNSQQVVTDDRVVLIDFEYCSYNFRGFDVANHFCEWAVDYSNPEFPHFWADFQKNYPNEAQRRHFVTEYLKQYRKQTKDKNTSGLEFEAEVAKILTEAHYFTLASHFLWTLWGINNAFSSEIKFGYWEYGKTRLEAYLNHKKCLTSCNNNNDEAVHS